MASDALVIVRLRRIGSSQTSRRVERLCKLVPDARRNLGAAGSRDLRPTRIASSVSPELQSRERKGNVMAPVEITQPGFEYYGHPRRSHPLTITRLGPVVKAESQEKSHDESKALRYCLRRIGVDGKCGKRTVSDGQSYARPTSVAYICADLRVCSSPRAAKQII